MQRAPCAGSFSGQGRPHCHGHVVTPRAQLDPAWFDREFDRAARAEGFSSEPFGAVAGHPLRTYRKRASALRPSLYLSAGIHGDEPAPPQALLRLVQEGCFGPQANWTICPLLNPTGMARATRENAAGIDLNRDYQQPVTPEVRAHVGWLQRQARFLAAICLHEDYEATGFYLYELNPDRRPSAADATLAAVAPLCPIEQAAVIDGREADALGIIRPITDPLLRDQWPEAIYLAHHHTTLSYTFETPTTRTLEQRMATHGATIRAALGILTRETTD